MSEAREPQEPQQTIPDRSEIRIGGFGGQGIMLAGYIIGRAAALYGGLEACVRQSYGPEARGGACHSDVVVSKEPILYPILTEPTVLVLLSQESFDVYGREANEKAVLLIDQHLVTGPDSALQIPATRSAEELGNRMAANVVMLGAFAATTGLIRREAMQEAIKNSVRSRFIDLNLRAFDVGFDCGHALVPEGVRLGERGSVA